MLFVTSINVILNFYLNIDIKICLLSPKCSAGCSVWIGFYGLQRWRLVHQICLETSGQGKVRALSFIPVHIIIHPMYMYLCIYSCLVLIFIVLVWQHYRGWSERCSSQFESCCWDFQSPEGEITSVDVLFWRADEFQKWINAQEVKRRRRHSNERRYIFHYSLSVQSTPHDTFDLFGRCIYFLSVVQLSEHNAMI